MPCLPAIIVATLGVRISLRLYSAATRLLRLKWSRCPLPASCNTSLLRSETSSRSGTVDDGVTSESNLFIRAWQRKDK